MSSAPADEGSPSTVSDRRRRPTSDCDVEPDASQRVRFAADYQDHHEAVVAEAIRICGPDHAGEVADTIFLTLLREPHRVAAFGGNRRLSLLTLASLLAGEVLEREHARRALGAGADLLEATACAGAGEDLLRCTIEARVAAALDGLPSRERDAIGLAFLGQLSYRATAARLAQPEDTIKSSIRNGLRRLREVTIDSPARSPSHSAEGTSKGQGSARGPRH